MTTQSGKAEQLYQAVSDLPIISPHGHTDPRWFAENQAFADPAELLIIPDHYVFRMLYSQGISLTDLGIGSNGKGADSRRVFQIFATYWHLFLGTPSRVWVEYVLRETLGIKTPVSAETADLVYDQIAEKLSQEDHRPRALFNRFGIEALATTDSALDDLNHHATIRDSGWNGRVLPTFRPDGVLDANDPAFVQNFH